jgi:hypothetical protein
MRPFPLSRARNVRVATLILSLGAVASWVVAGCDELASRTDVRSQTGSAFVRISPINSADVAGATITVMGADIPVPITASLTKSAGEWKVMVGGIPSGSDRIFTLSATDASGTEQYRGQATGVTINAGETEDVVIVAQQTSASAGFSDSAPVIDVVQASSSSVAPGATVNLNVNAHDPDVADTLAYTWSAAGGGVLSSSNASSATWTAPTATGTYVVMVAVKDTQQETVTASVQITVSTITPPPPAPVPIPPWARWLLVVLLAAAGLGSLHSRRYA